jgi:hypothetical protein
MPFNTRRFMSITCSLLLALSSLGALGEEEDEIVTGCHFSNAEWGSEMIDRCIRDNQATRALVLQYPEQHKAIIDRCRRGNGNGWSWVKTCVDRDIEAETALAQYPKEMAGSMNICQAEFGHRGAAAIKACVDNAIDASTTPNKN